MSDSKKIVTNEDKAHILAIKHKERMATMTPEEKKEADRLFKILIQNIKEPIHKKEDNNGSQVIADSKNFFTWLSILKDFMSVLKYDMKQFE